MNEYFYKSDIEIMLKESKDLNSLLNSYKQVRRKIQLKEEHIINNGKK